MFKKIAIGLLAVLVIIQFIRPAKNQSTTLSPNDISVAYVQLPKEVHAILVKKCYDCHSNNTNYPWYASIQPVAWWMNGHITDGKKHLDFSEFKTYSEKKALHKLEELSEAVTDGWMPLDSYTLIHKDAIVSSEDAAAINAWIAEVGGKVADKGASDEEEEEGERE